MITKNKRRYLLGPVALVYATEQTGTWRLMRPQVAFSECTACGICATFCPCAIITVRKREAEPVVFDWDICKGCGVCANVCPRHCIEMVSEGGQNE
jgi:pyruvate ferredoxin oxidoreductase delta subunit